MSEILEVGLAERRSAAVEQLAALVRDWKAHGRITTTAGIKSALMQSPGGFDPGNLGFPTFRDFVSAAAAEGAVTFMRQDNGHWLIGLPDRSPKNPSEVGTSGGTQSPSAAETVGMSSPRLRTDVWNCFVEWSEEYQRMWDRDKRRAFMCPVDQEGRPLWESQPARFTPIEPAEQAVQIHWMHEFAAQHDQVTAGVLDAALTTDAPRGSFRRALDLLGLQAAWRRELQRHIAQYALEWAADHDVSSAALLVPDKGPSVQRPVAIVSSTSGPAPASEGGGRGALGAQTVTRASATTGVAPATPPEAEPSQSMDSSPQVSDLHRLRARLHRVIDSMTLDELASLPIRAGHLLD